MRTFERNVYETFFDVLIFFLHAQKPGINQNVDFKTKLKVGLGKMSKLQPPSDDVTEMCIKIKILLLLVLKLE